jgi:plastocyanin
MASNAIVYAGIAIAVVAIVLAVVASASIMQVQDIVSGLVPAMVDPQTREFYLFSEVDENIDEDRLGIPPDKFSLGEITVNKGDRVVIHFYNLEPEETQERHTFSMFEAYQMHYDINAGEDRIIEFVADKSGIFQYQCVYHMPTMAGNLVVLSS